MKSRLMPLSALFLSLLLGLPGQLSAEETKKTLVLAAATWPPYVDPEAPNDGAGMDLVDHIFQRAGYKTTHKIQSWSRTLEGTNIGIYDVIATVWYTEERNKSLHFSEPYYTNVIRFVKRIDSPITLKYPEEFNGLMVGIVSSFAYGKNFDAMKSIIRITNNHVIQNLLLLERGRIDLTLGDQWVIRNELTQYFPNAIKQFAFVGKPVDKRGLRIGVTRSRPDHDKIVSDFNKALASMKKDGSYEKLLEGYRKELIKLRETPL